MTVDALRPRLTPRLRLPLPLRLPAAPTAIGAVPPVDCPGRPAASLTSIPLSILFVVRGIATASEGSPS